MTEYELRLKAIREETEKAQKRMKAKHAAYAVISLWLRQQLSELKDLHLSEGGSDLTQQNVAMLAEIEEIVGAYERAAQATLESIEGGVHGVEAGADDVRNRGVTAGERSASADLPREHGGPAAGVADTARWSGSGNDNGVEAGAATANAAQPDS